MVREGTIGHSAALVGGDAGGNSPFLRAERRDRFRRRIRNDPVRLFRASFRRDFLGWGFHGFFRRGFGL